MISLPCLPRFRVPIQFRPGTLLYNLRVNYGYNPDKHILMLENAVMDLERQLDASQYQLEKQQRAMQRIEDNLRAYYDELH